MMENIKKAFFPEYICVLLISSAYIAPSAMLGIIMSFIIFPIHSAMFLASLAVYIIIHGVFRLIADILELEIYLTHVYESCKFYYLKTPISFRNGL